ncbi:MAG: two-component regulator propeller domain-containing protein, partial [Candidatus Poribacteria bacterium]|nr:two-component regulator propeller domain-containing protein [Candidatus Poribacteria bacterium]
PSDRQKMVWTSFQTQKTGLSADYISVITERRNGEVWVGTPVGVCWQRLGDKSWQKAQTPYVTGIYEDLQNQLWLAHQPANRVADSLALLTLIEPDGKNWQLFGTQDGLPNGQIQAMVTDRQNRLWVGTTKGLVIYNEQKWSADFRSLDLIGHNVQTLHLDQNQTLWVGTNQGIRLLIDLNSGNEVAFQHLTKSNGIAGNNITALCESPSGNIWVGTRDNGISFSDRSWRTFQIAQPEISRVTSFATDARGSVWIGMQNGIGRIIPDPQHNQLSRLDLVPQSIAPNTEVRSLAYAANGEVWAGTAAGVLIFDGRTWRRLHLPSGTGDTQALIIDDGQQVWLSTALLLPGDAVGFLPTLLKYQLGTPLQKVEVLRLAQDQIGRAVTNLFIDSRRRLLLGTVGNMLIPSDLWIYDLTTDQLSEISRRQFGQIQAILEIGQRIWVGTNQGIYILNLGLKEKIEHHYTTNVGLIDNNVQALFQDRQGRIWVGTSEGVSVFESDRVVRQLTVADGLGSNNILAITQTDTDEMLFGTAGNGISYFKQELVPPVTRIVEGPNNNEIIGETSVTFKFEGGDASSQVFHYHYQIDQGGFRLTGEDGNENRVVLSGLSEGQHHFEVQAIDRENNVDPVGATATFIIDSLPPMAQILSPVDGQVVGGRINIQGTATDSSDFSNYTVQIFSDAGDRKIIHHVIQPVDRGTLFLWHTNGLADGAYSVQLTVKDTLNSLSDFQHTAQATVDLIVDNTAPEVNIQSPRSGEQLSGTVRLNFELRETHSNTIQLRYRRRTASSWLSSSSLALSDPLVQSSQPGLYSYLWETTGLDGQIDLQIQAVDLAGNLAQSSVVYLTLDNPSTRPNIHLEPIAKIVSGTVDIFATIRVGLANEAQI